MKIALHNPMFSGASGLHGWILEFIKAYRPAFYISDVRYFPRFAHFMYTYKLNPLSFRVLLSEKELCSYADVLLCFNGHPHRPESKPVKNFSGLKIYHLMDYSCFPHESHAALKEGGVDSVLGYAKHDLYCPFFKRAYPSFQGKVIVLPFGFSSRFVFRTPFAERSNKVVALGSVNSFDDPVHAIQDFREMNTFFLNRGEKFMHKFRRMLVEHERQFTEWMDSKLPHYPQTKDFGYDLVAKFNEYRMFVSCESLLYFPPAKAFEGPAAGTVMVCSDHACFTDYGFEDGVNCVKHKEFDLRDLEDKVSYYMSHEDELARIQKDGTRFVREMYNHQSVAQSLYKNISVIYKNGS